MSTNHRSEVDLAQERQERADFLRSRLSKEEAEAAQDQPVKVSFWSLRLKVALLVGGLLVPGLALMMAQGLVDARERIIQRYLQQAQSTLQVLRTVYDHHHQADARKAQGTVGDAVAGVPLSPLSYGDWLPESVNRRLLEHIQMVAVGIRARTGIAVQLRATPPAIDETIFVFNETYWDKLSHVFRVITRDSRWLVRLVGYAKDYGNWRTGQVGGLADAVATSAVSTTVEMVFEEGESELRRVLSEALWDVVMRSLLTIFMLMVLMVLALERQFVARLRGLVSSIVVFRSNPVSMSGPSALSRFPRAPDEVDVVAWELDRLRREVSMRFQDQQHLVAIGGAVAKINHDLRGTLAPAMMMADQLVDGSQDSQQRRAASDVIEALEKMQALSETILAFVRNPSRAYKMQRVEILSMLRKTADDPCFQGIDLQISGDHDRSTVIMADLVHFPRVFWNLWRNAQQAGALRVECQVVQDSDTVLDSDKSSQPIEGVKIFVSDDGPGIPESVQRNLFRPFVCGRNKSGNGLGLVIAQELIAIHGGELSLQSSDASGTIWKIHLPTAKEGS